MLGVGGVEFYFLFFMHIYFIEVISHQNCLEGQAFFSVSEGTDTDSLDKRRDEDPFTMYLIWDH